MMSRKISPILPASAFEGKNVTEPSEEMDWYDGPVFLSALDTFEVPEKPVDKPLRIPIQDVYSITGVGTVPVGRVETGVVEPGDELVFAPSGNKAEVKSIEMHHEEVDKAEPGDNIGFNVRGLSKEEVKRGEVASHTGRGSHRCGGIFCKNSCFGAPFRYNRWLHSSFPCSYGSGF